MLTVLDATERGVKRVRLDWGDGDEERTTGDGADDERVSAADDEGGTGGVDAASEDSEDSEDSERS